MLAISAWLLCALVTVTGTWGQEGRSILLQEKGPVEKVEQKDPPREYTNYEKAQRVVRLMLDNCWEDKNRVWFSGPINSPTGAGRVNEPSVGDYLYCVEMAISRERARIDMQEPEGGVTIHDADESD